MGLRIDATAKMKDDISPSLGMAMAVATDLLADVMQFRRVAGPGGSCATSPCPECLAPHLSQVVAAVAQGRPVTFVLPAFPGKSPNPAKVLGPLPDMAERRSLEFLGHLCDRVRQYHSPGARVILCSDGRVFNDVVGMRDGDVTAYQRELSFMIEALSLTSLSTFNLDAVYAGLPFEQKRQQLMEQYGEPLDAIRAEIRAGGKPQCSPESEEAHRQYCGITRFLVEDAMHPDQMRSRSALQRECRSRAYEVIRRSRAWSGLLANRFPDAVRLSIHPQTCGSRKLGIRLMEADSWMTPWHGVAVDVGGRFVLLKRSEVEALGARMINFAGRPSHYELLDEQGPSQPHGVSYGA